MNRRVISILQVVSVVVLAAIPALAAKSSSPSYVPGLVALGPLWMYWLCNSQKHKSIGGWLLYFYIQIYLGVLLVVAVFLVSSLPQLEASRWTDQTAFALFTLKSILPVVMITAQAIMATVLLKKREWMMVNLLRGVFVADLLSAVFCVAIDTIYWPSMLVRGMAALLWPIIWLGYFSYSKRVQRVFKTHDWESVAVTQVSIAPEAGGIAGRSLTTPGLTNPGMTTQSQTAPVELRFFLTAEEFDEGISTLRTRANNPAANIVMRLACGLGAYFLWRIPSTHGQTWSEFFREQPVFAIWLAILLVFDGLIVLGVLQSPKINRLANRLDWERRICFSDRGVDVNWGARMNFHYRWQDLLFFQETPTLFILKAGGTQFWTMPKRAIPAGFGDKLRVMLSARLPQK
ncbi:MAG: YcxB family protein [Candidatus Sulfotelmatobacter sp.]